MAKSNGNRPAKIEQIIEANGLCDSLETVGEYVSVMKALKPSVDFAEVVERFDAFVRIDDFLNSQHKRGSDVQLTIEEAGIEPLDIHELLTIAQRMWRDKGHEQST
jgi:hypothetical protein